MKLLLFILFFVPLISYSQITVIKVTKQRDMFTEKVIREGWPEENSDSWYGNPDVHGLTISQTSSIWYNTRVGKRTFYTNISENQRIFRGDSIHLISGGGAKYEWNTGDSTRVIKVAPIDTTTYTVTMTDDNRTDTQSVTVFVVDRPINLQPINLGNDYTICNGTAINIISNYVTSTATYLWSTGETTQSITITPTSTQFYSVIVTDIDYSKTDSILIIVNNCI